MKKLFFVFIIIAFFSSCKKDEPLPTTYQIFNSSNRITTNTEYLDGSMYEVIVYHYSATNMIQEDSIGDIPTNGGKTEILDVPADAVMFKVSFKFLPSISPRYNEAWNVRFYLTSSKKIVREDNNIFGINGGSFISDKIGKSNSRVVF